MGFWLFGFLIFLFWGLWFLTVELSDLCLFPCLGRFSVPLQLCFSPFCSGSLHKFPESFSASFCRIKVLICRFFDCLAFWLFVFFIVERLALDGWTLGSVPGSISEAPFVIVVFSSFPLLCKLSGVPRILVVCSAVPFFYLWVLWLLGFLVVCFFILGLLASDGWILGSFTGSISRTLFHSTLIFFSSSLLCQPS